MSHLKDPESQGYGSIPGATRTVAESEAEEGPFPVDLKSALIAETIGTAVLVQSGTAANCVALYIMAKSAPLSALIWGLGLMVGIYFSAPLSGGHLNPAISFSFALVRPPDFSFRKLLPYIAAQLLGAFLAGLVNLFLFHQAIRTYETKNGLTRGDGSYQSAAGFTDYWSLNDDHCKNAVHAFFIEAFGTAALAFAVFALTNKKNPVPGAAVPPIVGATLGILVFTIGPLTGAGLNPARDMGPRLVTLVLGWGRPAMTDWLPYLLGPLLGGPVGAFVADKVLFL